MFKYLPEESIACENYENALELAKLLVEEGYVVMLSKEDHIVVLNYIWTPYGDRNDVVFVSREDYDMAIIENEILEEKKSNERRLESAKQFRDNPNSQIKDLYHLFGFDSIL